MKKLQKLLDRQFSLNGGKNLLFRNFHRLFEVDLAFLEGLVASMSAVSEAELEKLIAYTVRGCLKTVYEINQYIRIDSAHKSDLAGIYRSTWKMIMSGEDPERVILDRHYPALSKWIDRLYPEALSRRLKEVEQINPLACSEYSPEFQLTLLRAELRTLREPVLDIGCGSGGMLVRYLLSRGIRACGIDRLIESGSEHFREADWLAYDYGEEQWGTVISNNAFSNHFRYVLRYEERFAESYLRAYRVILESLCIGGSFYYAPSIDVPACIPDSARFRYETYPVTGGYAAVKVTRIGL